MPEAKVYYWKDAKYSYYPFVAAFAETGQETRSTLPTREQFDHDYCLVATLPYDPRRKPTEVANDAFNSMNVEPHRHFRRAAYTEGVGHTSMSVGDIVIVAELALFTMPVGWEQVRL
jgi:hypothetical protein